MEKKYYQLLKRQYPNKHDVAREIINLKAILNLPKATEHFISDVHGEYEAFQHVLRSGSGNVRLKINTLFGDKYNEAQLRDLATLVYYPEERIQQMKDLYQDEVEYLAWYQLVLEDLVTLCLYCSTKYTRSKVRKAMPRDFSYIIDELLFQKDEFCDKEDYYQQIVTTVFELDEEDHLLTGICYLIQQLVVDHLHLVGDIYDRGPHADLIIDRMMEYHSLDIQWGNHDVLWMAAALGVPVCIANVVRISLRYNNLDVLEEQYGINLRPLLNYAEKYYPVTKIYQPKAKIANQSELEWQQVCKMHQAIAVLQFKLEGQAIKRNPDFCLSRRDLLPKLSKDKKSITINGVTYHLLDSHFPTVDSKNPNQLTPEEEALVEQLIFSFRHSEKLQRHTKFLFEKGGMYTIYNGNLLFHGCMPLNQDGSYKVFHYQGKDYQGKELLSIFDKKLRELYHNPEPTSKAADMAWYLWTGENSPLFGKKEMTTFERYYIKNKKTHHEEKNPYYQLRKEAATCEFLLRDFGLNPETGHIINGHTPVKEKDGETPILAGGKMLVIDGGFSKAYQAKTGIAGYTLLCNSYGMELAAHGGFTCKEDAIKNGTDIHSTIRVVDRNLSRKKVKDTTIGEVLKEQLRDLKELYALYDLVDCEI